MISHQVVQLTQYFKEQLAYYQEIYSIAVEQVQLCRDTGLDEEENLSRMVSLLGRREQLAGQVQIRQKKIHRILADLKELSGQAEINMDILSRHFPSAQLEPMRATIDRLKPVLGQIAALDGQMRQAFDLQLETVRGKLARLQKGKQVNCLYHPVKQQTEGCFIDRKQH